MAAEAGPVNVKRSVTVPDKEGNARYELLLDERGLAIRPISLQLTPARVDPDVFARALSEVIGPDRATGMPVSAHRK